MWESSLSQRPPCPGSKDPESLRLLERFIKLSNKSPANAKGINRMSVTIILNGKHKKNAITAVKKAAIRKPPRKPSSVLFGLIRGIIEVLPKLDPTMYAKTSTIAVWKISKNKNKNLFTPSSLCSKKINMIPEIKPTTRNWHKTILLKEKIDCCDGLRIGMKNNIASQNIPIKKILKTKICGNMRMPINIKLKIPTPGQ